MTDEQHTPARLNCPATASFHTSDPSPMLRTADFDAITTAEELQLAAQTVGQGCGAGCGSTATQTRCWRSRRGTQLPAAASCCCHLCA